ncbi:MAG: hypothetical protein HC892_01475 [Saprospiraceae bacterium]|nr:hypothetical protein [Saprospiraceae bacterium]
MAQQIINIGSAPDAGDGDMVRDAFSKTKDNFAELYNQVYPELFPTLTNPNNTLTLTQAGLHEIGEVIATLNFASTFSRGTITPAYGTSGFRSGLPTVANAYVYGGTGLTNSAGQLLTDNKTVSNYTVLSGVQSWTCLVNYLAGEQPLSSRGNNYSTPLAAGATSNKTVSITGVYPYYYNSSNLTTATKQALTNNGAMVQVSMLAEDGINKQFIEFPTGWGAITQITQYNTLSGQWDVISLGSFTQSAQTHDIQGNTINYTRYTNNLGTIGARQLRFYTT